MKFTKMHGSLNDYAVIDGRGLDYSWGDLARQACNRRTGIGADGILVVLSSTVADIRMGMFNPDGSEAEMCGNGIRCFTKFVLERGIVDQQKTPILVETLSGIKSIRPIWENGTVVRALVNMGQAGLTPSEIPVSIPNYIGNGPIIDYPLSTPDGLDLKLTFVSMGNPHAVAFIDQPVEEFPLESIGPIIEHHNIFPNRVNFSIVNVKNKTSLSARVWERGAGETQACGTGACAIAVASNILGYTTENVQVELPGGTLDIAVDNTNGILMQGPAEEVFEGELNYITRGHQ